MNVRTRRLGPLAVLLLLLAALTLAAGAQGRRRGSAARGSAFALDGLLETVTHDAISVLSSDGTIYEAWLGPNGAAQARQLAAAGHIGDEVTLEADFISSQFVAADDHFFDLRLRQLQRRRPGSSKDERRALASPAWRDTGNLLPPPAGVAPPAPVEAAAPADDAFLALARPAILHYAAELPNFLVTETLTRRIQGGGDNGADHIESQLAVADGREYRSAITLNGVPWPHPFAQLPGLNWNSDFAERLLPIFAPACGASLQHQGATSWNGTPVERYSFRLAPGRCAGSMRVGPARAFPGLEGQLDIAVSSHLVVHLEERYIHLPPSFEESSSRDTTDWGMVAVAGAMRLLPQTSVLEVELRTGSRYQVSARYSDYRRFETTSHMTVVGPAANTPAANHSATKPTK